MRNARVAGSLSAVVAAVLIAGCARDPGADTVFVNGGVFTLHTHVQPIPGVAYAQALPPDTFGTVAHRAAD